MFSCASNSRPEQLTIHVPPHFSGTAHINTCMAGAASNEITLDAKGEGQTSLCPARGHRVEVEVIANDRHQRFVDSELNLQRTGDGIPTSIEFHIQPSAASPQ
jgi:hypothetical protein